MNGLNHIDGKGNAVMVDVSEKPETFRTAVASGRVRMAPGTFKVIKEGLAGKGDVIGVARIAGIMAAKKTHELIPLCHPLATEKVTVDFELIEESHEVRASCSVSVTGKTGVEMEALTGVSVALLTIYDMCKAIDRAMVITEIALDEKRGGKSGTYIREAK